MKSSDPFSRSKPNRLRLILLGTIGRMPVAGIIWQVLHYLEGLRRLGVDVYYIEDTGTWPYDPQQNTVSEDCSYAVNLLNQIMAAHGFADRWAYMDPIRHGHSYGLSDSQVLELFGEADVLINLSASTVLRDEHLRVPLRIYLETDPVLPQIEIAKDHSFTIDLLSAHTHHYTYGENFGAPDCGVPIQRFHYFPTRQPIVLDWWSGSSACTKRTDPARACFTTIASWRQSGKDIDWSGERYTWSKHHEFLKIIDLPRKTSQPLELALALNSDNLDDAKTIEFLTTHGWRVKNGFNLSLNISSYRDYILHSRGEFTVAKDQNIRLRSGWFSDRSACYLAAGCPVITQDTGFAKFIPTGEGLFSFATMDDITTALEEINADYVKHKREARAIAGEYFAAENVLSRMLNEVGV
jgi:hypothetical protein